MGRMEDFWQKAVDFMKKFDKKGDLTVKRPVWKRFNTLLMVAAAGALLMMLSNVFAGGSSDVIPQSSEPVKSEADTEKMINSDIAHLEGALAGKLEEVLTQIDGVGRVKVTVNLASTTEKDYAVNASTTQKNTTERDKNGGNRTITEINENGQIVLVRENQGNRELPVVVKELQPEVRGVIVVAEGAGDSGIKSDLMNAVQVYLDVPLYKVVVLPLVRG